MPEDMQVDEEFPVDDLLPEELAEELAELDEEDQPDPNAELIAERDKLRDQLLRTMADFQNFRKRAIQERQQIQRFATEELVRGLLPAMDNFGRTIQAASSGASLDSLVEGVKLVERQIWDSLAARDVVKIDTVGQQFDPEYHEAIGTDVSEELDEGTITVEVESGYKMADRVLRPARVRVAKKQ